MTLYQKLRVWYYTHRKPKREKINIATLLECHRIITEKNTMSQKPQAPIPLYGPGPVEPPHPPPPDKEPQREIPIHSTPPK